MPLRGKGGVRRLIANAILNFHFFIRLLVFIEDSYNLKGVPTIYFCVHIAIIFGIKIFLSTHPGTRTFLQVPNPSRPEVKKHYLSGPGHNSLRGGGGDWWVAEGDLGRPWVSEGERGGLRGAEGGCRGLSRLRGTEWAVGGWGGLLGTPLSLLQPRG